MSGPKCYTPPPRYSMQVFDGKLNQVFQLQSRLKMLRSEIEGLHITDPDLSIYFDCKNELDKLKRQIDGTLKSLVFDYKGTFGQEVYDRINSEIELKLTALQKQLDLCTAVKADFTSKKADYDSYRSYLLFYDNSKVSFDDFKSQIIFYLRSNIEAQLPDVFTEAKNKISDVQFQKEKKVFNFGFNSRFDSEKQAVVNHIAQKEEDVNCIRVEISNEVLDKVQMTSAVHNPIERQNIEIPDDTASIIEKIKLLVRRCEDVMVRKTYTDNLRRLTESESLKDIYFFKELHDSILDTEKTRKAKIEVSKLLSELNETPVHQITQGNKQNLIGLCLKSLNGYSITKNELDALQVRFEQVKKRSNECFEEELIRHKERLFLKSQIVLCLENLGYEVMDDLEVIDFEKENNLLLKIHDQENYLNLKFKEDGSMRYVFQIPENQNDLNTDEKNLKLHEMKVTCDEFQSVLQDLSKMGLDVNLKSERPIEVDSLVTVSSSHRDKLKDKSKIKRNKHQFKEKYLSRSAG